jgi:putative sporulation protein YtaF
VNYSDLIHKTMMLVALAIAANLDNLGVGIAYGIGRDRISNFSNLLIALLSASLTFIAMMFGQWLQHILAPQVANSLGAVVIIGVGIWVYWESAANQVWSLITRTLVKFLKFLFPRLAQKPQKIERSSDNEPRTRTRNTQSLRLINLPETLILGVSLALNAMAGGFGASLSNHSAVITSLAIGVFSYITIDLGQRLAKSYLSSSLGSLSQKVAGLLLILIGVYELFI